MKKKGHPPYQDILFVDTATGYKFVCGSTLQPEETEVYEGKEYPVYRVPISSASHPFFTGTQQFVDSEGRVDKFRKRYTRLSSSKKEADQASDKALQHEKNPSSSPSKKRAATTESKKKKTTKKEPKA